MRMTFFLMTLLCAAGACGPRFPAAGPGAEPLASPVEATAGTPAAPPDRPVVAAQGPQPLAREVLLGEMCPRAAAGRPAVLPLVLRTISWSVNSDDVSLPIENRAARVFSVMSWEGRRAGVFSVAGAADVGRENRVAVGSYAGTSPCDVVTGETTFERDSACVRAQADCGLAIAQLDRRDGSTRPYEEDPVPVDLPTGGACVAGDKLVVDLDSDGMAEAFPARDFLSPARAPAEEVLAAPAGSAACTPAFAQRQVIPHSGTNHFLGMDLIGVVDLDTDGRYELIMVYQYEEKRTWAVYSAGNTTARLELMAEALPWQQR